MGAQCSTPEEPTSVLFQDGKFIVYYTFACKQFWGRCLPIGMLLEAGGVPYEWKTTEEKPEDIGFAVPVLTFPDGTSIGQTPVIVLALGEGLGFSPKTAPEKMKHNQLVMDAQDFIADRDKPQERLDKWHGYFEKILSASASGYLMQSLTAADFALFHGVWFSCSAGKLSQSQFPKLVAWYDKISKLPAAKKFLDSEVPVFPGLPPGVCPCAAP